MSCRVALRAGVDGCSLLEALLVALVMGDRTHSHQVGLQEGLSALLRSPELAMDGVLLMNCVTALQGRAPNRVDFFVRTK